MSATTLTALLANLSNATTNATFPLDCHQWSGSSVLPEVSCDEAAIEVLRAILITCGVVLLLVLATMCALVVALVLQVRKLCVLIQAMRAVTESGAEEVCSGLLTTPRLRSCFKSKGKKPTTRKAKFTDVEDTACSAPRDIDEEEL
jgi:hypothetical protein